MHVHERLARSRRLEQRVPPGRAPRRAGRRSRGRGPRRAAARRSARPSPRRGRRRSSTSGCRRSPGSETRTRPGSALASQKARTSRLVSAVQPPSPTTTSGRSAAASSSRTRPSSSALGTRRGASTGGASATSASSASTSSGSASTTGPGRPDTESRDRLGDVLGDALRRVDLPRCLRDPPEDPRVVEFLPGLASAKRARDLADEEEHRRRVLAGGVHADRRLGRARPARDEADARPPRELADRFRRVRRALLVAAGDEPDRRVVERVEHRQVALARDAEGELDPVSLELVDEDPAARPHSRSGSSSSTVARWSRGLSSSAGSR